MFRIRPRPLVLPLVLAAISATSCSTDDTSPFNSVDAIAPPGVGVADYFDLPASAAGPEIPEAGYLVEEINDGVYWITEGTYHSLPRISLCDRTSSPELLRGAEAAGA